MGFKTVNTLWRPAMLERGVQLRRQRLQLHAAFEGIRRFRTSPDDLADVFFNIDERQFHNAARVGHDQIESKPRQFDSPTVVQKFRWPPGQFQCR